MDSYIFGMIANVRCITLDVIGEQLMTVIFVRQKGCVTTIEIDHKTSRDAF